MHQSACLVCVPLIQLIPITLTAMLKTAEYRQIVSKNFMSHRLFYTCYYVYALSQKRFCKKSSYFLTLLFKVKMNARNFYQFRLKTFYFNFEPKKECPVHLAMNIMGTRNVFRFTKKSTICLGHRL